MSVSPWQLNCEYYLRVQPTSEETGFAAPALDLSAHRRGLHPAVFGIGAQQAVALLPAR